jgi:hypothetical protein
VTGPEMKSIRHGLSEAIGRRLSLADMARLCGMKDPGGNGRKVYRGWEEGGGPSGPVAVLLSLYAAGIGSDDDRSRYTFKFLLDIIGERLKGEA